MSEVVSHHMLRRTARAKARRLENRTGNDFRVKQTVRGPWRYVVVRTRVR